MRAFLIIADSLGIGGASDAVVYGDEGSDTLRSVSRSCNFSIPNLTKLGIGNICGVDAVDGTAEPQGAYARLVERSLGKDTTTGHWELAGLISHTAFPTYPKGFPTEIIDEFQKETGRKVLCNLPYSGTEVIKAYGAEHFATGALIVYTSADSVFQIASHEHIVPLEDLYAYCNIARRILSGKNGVARVIARPFAGEVGSFYRTENRRDFSLIPPTDTVLDRISACGKEVIAVGKINDIFCGKGITKAVPSHSNAEGMAVATTCAESDFEGLCFVNLVDFDMLYGHRNDVEGYAKALSAFDEALPALIARLKEDDILIITADHGCDPATASTDHSRENVPFLGYGSRIKKGTNLGTRAFSDVGATIAEFLGAEANGLDGSSFLKEILL